MNTGFDGFPVGGNDPYSWEFPDLSDEELNFGENFIVEAFSRGEDQIAEEIGSMFSEDISLAWFFLSENITEDSIPQLRKGKEAQKRIHELCSQGIIATENAKELIKNGDISPVAYENERMGKKQRNVHAHHSIKEKLEKNGFQVLDGNEVSVFTADEINVIAFTSDQMEKINQVAERVFKSFEEIQEERKPEVDRYELTQRKFLHLEPEDLPNNDRYPNPNTLNAIATEEASKRKDEHQEELILNDKYREKQKSRKEELDSLEKQKDIKELDNRKWTNRRRQTQGDL